MRVLLAQTTPFLTHRSWNYVEHLGLGFLEKALDDHGFSVDVLDATLDWRDSAFITAGAFSSDEPYALIGFSVNASNFPSTVDTIRALRQGGFLGHITLGGHFPTFHHGKILQTFPEVDSVVLGHGECTLVRLVECLSSGTSWNEVPGLAYIASGGQVWETPCYENEVFLKTVGIPFHRPLYGIARMITSRGCSRHCAFCSVNSFDRHNFKNHYLRRDLMEVLEEVDLLVGKHGVRHIWLSDMDFIGTDKGFIRHFCEEIVRKQYRLTLEGDCRVDELDEPLVALLARAGFNCIYFGVESFVPRQLLAYTKFSPEFDARSRVISAVDLLRKHDIIPRFGFIMFDKDSTMEELRLNHEVISATVGYGTLDSLATKLALLPGTKIELEYLKDARNCWQVPITAENRLQPHLYYTQYRFVDTWVSLVYEISFSYRNKFQRLQQLFDEELRANRITYSQHWRALWKMRDLFGDIYGEILQIAGASLTPPFFPPEVSDRLDDLLIRFCEGLGFARERVRSILQAEKECPGEPYP